LLDPNTSACSATSATGVHDVDVDLTSAVTELTSSWPSPCSDAAADTSSVSSSCKFDLQLHHHDYMTPEVLELLGSLYDDWLSDVQTPDPLGSFFSPPI